MSFQPDKSQLLNSFAILKKQALQTNEEWKDYVQERFYDQFIIPLPNAFFAYIKELNELDKLFETAELRINELKE